jgi:opacity protein-like surface antigen
MNFKMILGFATIAVLVLMAVASAASATTLVTNSVTQSGPVTLKETLIGSVEVKSTSGVFTNTCSSSTVGGTTSVFTGATVSGSISTLSFSNCTHEPIVVNSKGSFSIEVVGGGPSGTVRNSGVSLTMPVTFGGSVFSVTCTTSNTLIGTLDGVSTGTTKITINAILTCSGLLPSANWIGTYVITGHSIRAVS